jgi:cyd operon protein YbgT
MGVPRGGNAHFKESGENIPYVPGNPAAYCGQRLRTLIASGADGVPGLAQALLGAHFWARGYFSTTSGNITDDVILQYLQKHEPVVIQWPRKIKRSLSMWYFSWVLGVSFAISFSIINALWLEEKDLAAAERAASAADGV